MLEQIIVDQIIALSISVFPDVIGIYLFGSQNTNETHLNSDVDIALLSPNRLSAEKAFELISLLSGLCKKDIDMVDLRDCNTVTAAQVISTSLRIYTQNATLCDFFEVTAYSKYAFLNEERKGILEDIKLRGNIYGG